MATVDRIAEAKELECAADMVSAVAFAQQDDSAVCGGCGLRKYADARAAMRRKQLTAASNKLRRIARELRHGDAPQARGDGRYDDDS